MNTESDYSAMARTNPVFVTAKTAVCLMAQAEIPDAERIVRSLKIENKEPLQDLSGSFWNKMKSSVSLQSVNNRSLEKCVVWASLANESYNWRWLAWPPLFLV